MKPRIGYLEYQVLSFIIRHSDKRPIYYFSFCRSERKRIERLAKKGFCSIDDTNQCSVTPTQRVKIQIALYRSLHSEPDRAPEVEALERGETIL